MLSPVTVSEAITVYLRQDKLDFARCNQVFEFFIAGRQGKTYNEELHLAIISSKFTTRNNFKISLFLQILLTAHLLQNWGIEWIFSCTNHSKAVVHDQ